MRKTTVKEVKKWMKTLEENRYKKTYASDARRVSWLVNNNLSEDYEAMPVSMKKKWPKAAYKRERFLAKEFVKHLNSKQLEEHKIRLVIRRIIKEHLSNSQGELIDFKKGDLVKDINPDCPHHNSEGEVTKGGKKKVTYKVTNNGTTYKEGDELEKTVDQLVKISNTEEDEKAKKQPMGEGKFYAFFNRKKHTINGKSLYDAKQKAITQLKVPKSKVGLLAVVNAKEHDRGLFKFEGKLTEARKETIFDVAARVVKNKSMEKYKSGRGQVMVDMQSANLLVKVWKKINPKMKKILSDLGYKNPAQ